MNKFLQIIEDVTPEEVDRVATLFNKDVVTDVRSITERDTIIVTLKDGTSVNLKIVSLTEGEEDNEQQTTFFTPKDRSVLKAAGELGVEPTKRAFAFSDPVKNLGKTVGDFYNKLALRLKNIVSKMSL